MTKTSTINLKIIILLLRVAYRASTMTASTCRLCIDTFVICSWVATRWQ